MIKTISATGSLVASFPMSPPYFSTTSLGAGQVRYNPGTYSLEVYDGSYWQPMNGSVNISLTQHAEDAIQWAIKRMEQEKKIEQYANEYPAVQALKERYDTVKAELYFTMDLLR